MAKTPRPPLYRQIADEIKAQIEAGELRPGDSVPSLNRMVSERGVSPRTAEKVLAELRSQGLTQVVPGPRGTVVRGEDLRPGPIKIDMEAQAMLLVRQQAKKAGVPLADYIAKAAHDRALTDFYEGAAAAEHDHPPTDEEMRRDAERITAKNAVDQAMEVSGVA